MVKIPQAVVVHLLGRETKGPVSNMYRASGNAKSHAENSEDDVAEDAPFSPFSDVAVDLECFGGKLASFTQVAQDSEVFENGQAAEASGKVLQMKRRKNRTGEHSERILDALEKKGDQEDNEETDDFYREALDEFKETVAGRPDATIFWENLRKAQRQRIVKFCEKRGLVATEWPHRNAASGKVVVSLDEGPAPRGGDVKGKNRKR